MIHDYKFTYYIIYYFYLFSSIPLIISNLKNREGKRKVYVNIYLNYFNYIKIDFFLFYSIYLFLNYRKIERLIGSQYNNNIFITR